MADRYQSKSYPTGNDYDRDGQSHPSAKAEGDPLAELARLIGQTDPFATMGRANLPLQPHARPADRGASYDSDAAYDNDEAYDNYESPAEPEEGPAPGPPSWMQRTVRQETPPPPPQHDDYPSSVHPLHRYAAHPPPEPDYDPDQLFEDSPQEPDPSRYDDALYGERDSHAQYAQHDQAYADDAYAYDEEPNFDAEPPRRRGGMFTVVAVLALAVFGVGGAFAYRSYTGSARSGEPPIIRADAGPTKIIPAPADGTTKVPDRMASGDGAEKIVPREEAPVDLNARSGPRVVFPPLTPNGTAPLPSGVVPGSPPPVASGGTLPNGEPHRIKTFSVRGDQADAGVPAAAPPPAAPKPATGASRATAQRSPAAAANPNAANANGPLSLAPQAAAPAAQEPPVRVANNNPAQVAPPAGAASGNYLVQISSQRSEADAEASFKALQGKFPSVLGSRAPVIKRADLGEKGTYYRAMVGPFGSSDEASQFCGSLKSAGGQCVVQRN